MNTVKWLLGYAVDLKLRLPISLVTFTLTGILFIMTTYFQRWLIDDVFINGKYDLLLMILGFIALGAILNNALHAISGLMMSSNEFVIRKNLVHDYKKHLNSLPAKELQDQRTGEVLHTIQNEIPTVASFITQGILKLAREIIEIVVLAIIIFLSNPVMLAGLVLISVVYVWIGKVSFPKVEVIQRKKIELKSKYSVQLEESISSTREVVSFNRHEWEKNKLISAFSAYFEKVIEEVKWKNRQLFITEPVQWLPILFVMGYGGYSVLNGYLSLGLFVILFQFSQQFLNNISKCYDLAMGLPYQKAAIQRVRNKLDVKQLQDGTKSLGGIHQLALEKISFRYDVEQHDILHQISVKFPIGKKIAIVGASGGGKSTIAKLLLRYYEPQSGKIIVNGMNLSDVKRLEWFDKIAYVPQEPYLLPESIATNVTLGRENLSLEDVKAACKIAQIHSWIETLPDQYNTYVGERGIQLSGGQRQRVAIARAIIEQKEILILDEATSSLDQIMEKELQAALDEAWEGKTMINIAHRLSSVINADLIIVMNEGSVADMGTHEYLMQHCAIYKRLVDAGEVSN